MIVALGTDQSVCMKRRGSDRRRDGKMRTLMVGCGLRFGITVLRISSTMVETEHLCKRVSQGDGNTASRYGCLPDHKPVDCPVEMV